jgi:hypothetical protein
MRSDLRNLRWMRKNNSNENAPQVLGRVFFTLNEPAVLGLPSLRPNRDGWQQWIPTLVDVRCSHRCRWLRSAAGRHTALQKTG